MNEVLYAHLTPLEFRQRIAQAPIAYLPLGTLEWHGEHLPLGADGLQAQGFFIHLAREVGGIVLPMLFLGPDLHQGNHYGMDIVGFPKGQPHQLDGSAYWVRDHLFGELLENILSQLARAGFKIVVAHGHGPSTRYFQNHAHAWEKKFYLKLFNCWDPSAGMDDELGIQMDHAGANETSLMMALHPELVHLNAISVGPDGSPEAVIGKEPRNYASAELGEKAVQHQVNRMVVLLQSELTTLNPFLKESKA